MERRSEVWQTPWGRRWGVDLLLIVLLLGSGFAGSWSLSAKLPSGIVEFIGWFEADPDRVFLDMTNRWSSNDRMAVHPLFPSISLPPTLALQRLLHLSPFDAVRGVMALVSALWLSTLFLLLRGTGCRRPDALLFSALGAVSAAALFWFTVPETYGFGSLSILLALLPAVLARGRRARPLWFGLTGVFSFGTTVTNWTAGIAAALVRLPRRQALRLTVYVFCAVMLLGLGQRRFFPGASLPLDAERESRFLLLKESGGPLLAARSFFLHSMVMPAFHQTPAADPPAHCPATRAYFRTQHAGAGSAGARGTAAVCLWIALLLLGVRALVRGSAEPRTRLLLGLVLAGQLVLHLVYGAETFLYACHFLPLLVITASLATSGRTRLPALVLAGGLLVTAGLNNLAQFQRAAGLLDRMQADRGVPCLAGANLGRELAERPGLRAGLAGADLFGADARGADLAGCDLRGAFLRETRLQGANLSGAHLQGSTLLRANLTRARLGGADLTRARGYQVFAAGVDLSNATLDSTWFDGLVLDGADLRGARIRGSAWTDLTMERADLPAVEMGEVQMGGARLVGADLEGARLQGVDLRLADLRGTRWTGALLDGVRFAGAFHDARTVWPEGFRAEAAELGLSRSNPAALPRR